MFKATAYIVGPTDGPGAALTDMARNIGFETVLPFAGAAVAEQQSARTPLIYFLFAAVENVALLRSTAESIRHFPSRRLRMLPLIYFSESPSPEAIRACIGMGFDDVLTLPFTRERVVERLTRQVNRSLVYYETPTYFGPDRRSGSTPTAEERRNAIASRVRRFEIVRTVSSGVSILRDDARAA